MEIGRVCVKVAGRDAGLKCVVVDVLDKSMVLIDGQTRRRKCNVSHLEPLAQTLDIDKNASHDEVVSAFKKLGVEIVERKSRPAVAHHRKSAPKPAEAKPKVAKKTIVKKAPVKKAE